MTNLDSPYDKGAADALAASGLNKEAANDIALTLGRLHKKASLFGSDYGNGPSMMQILLPLLAAGAAGYVGYQAGAQGDSNRSAFSNIKNYLGRSADKLIRRSRVRPLYDTVAYANNK